MLTVITYCWGTKYQPDDVRRLKGMVQRYLTIPHEFAVITDKPEAFSDVKAIPIDWSKHVRNTCFVRLMTFHPAGAGMIGDKILQIDLDTIIVGNMNAIVSRYENLVLWRNPTRIPWDEPVMAGRPYYNTSILLHRCGTMPWLWARFDPERPTCRDDQWWLSERLGPDVPHWDSRDGIYRMGREDTPGSGVNGELPSNARIVTFPGSEGKWTQPEIAAANPWIAEHVAA